MTHSVELRPAELADEHLLFCWVNDQSVRVNSLSKKVITYEEHIHWFRHGLVSSSRIHYIALFHNTPIGQIRFDRVSPSKVVVDISVDQKYRGNGFASLVIEAGLAMLYKEWGTNIEVYAYVFMHNISSSRAFARAGFTLFSSDEANGNVLNCYRFLHDS